MRELGAEDHWGWCLATGLTAAKIARLVAWSPGPVNKRKPLISLREGAWKERMGKGRGDKSCYSIDSMMLVWSSFYTKLPAFSQEHRWNRPLWLILLVARQRPSVLAQYRDKQRKVGWPRWQYCILCRGRWSPIRIALEDDKLKRLETSNSRPSRGQKQR